MSIGANFQIFLNYLSSFKVGLVEMEDHHPCYDIVSIWHFDLYSDL